jgi:hypothetical protein
MSQWVEIPQPSIVQSTSDQMIVKRKNLHDEISREETGSLAAKMLPRLLGYFWF